MSQSRRFTQAQQGVEGEKQRGPKAIAGVNEGQQTEREGAAADGLDAAGGQPQPLEEVERPRQQRVKERQREAPHDQHLLHMPETQRVGQGAEEAGGARAAGDADEQIHAQRRGDMRQAEGDFDAGEQVIDGEIDQAD